MTPPQIQARELPVLKAFGHMLAGLRAHWLGAFKLALPWLALMAVLDIWSLNIKPFKANPTAELNLTFVDLISVLVGLLATSSIAVSWHRFILTDAPLHAEPAFRIDKIVWTYLGRSFLIYFLCLIPIVALVFIRELSGAVILQPLILGFIVMLIVFICRMSISLPAVAIIKPAIGLKHAMEATRRNNLRILGLIGLSFVSLAIPFLVYLVVIGAMSNLNPKIAIVAAAVLGIPLQFYSVMMNATLLTSLYGFFIEKRDF